MNNNNVSFDDILERVCHMKKTYKKERIERFINTQYKRGNVNSDEKTLLFNCIKYM